MAGASQRSGVSRCQPCLRLTSGSGRESPMPYEFPEGGPRSESLPPREDDEDQRAHNLARLHERIMEERLDPAFRVEGRRMEAPAVGRVQDDPRHLPDSIHEEVRRDAEADEPEDPEPWCEAHREDGEQEDEGVGPDPRLEAQGIAERLVEQVREERTEQDEPVVASGGGFAGEQPRQPESDPEMSEQEHITPSVTSVLTIVASWSVGGSMSHRFDQPTVHGERNGSPIRRTSSRRTHGRWRSDLPGIRPGSFPLRSPDPEDREKLGVCSARATGKRLRFHSSPDGRCKGAGKPSWKAD